jgi:hypothetical protein
MANNGQTDMTKLRVAFRNIAMAPKNMLNIKKSQNARKFTHESTNKLKFYNATITATGR